MAFFPGASRAVVSKLLPLAVLAAVLAGVPFAADDYRAYQLGIYLLYGIAAQGIALCWGRAGFLPLGQAVFFGLGAYLSGTLLKLSSSNAGWLALLPLAALLPAALAWAVAKLVFAKRHDSGPYFSLITLALAMLGAQLAGQWTGVTGGFNGLNNIPELPGLGRYDTLYWFIAATTVLVTAFMVWLNATPFGTLLAATAQNEGRLQFFGFATDNMKAIAFGISGAGAALAGMLYAPHQGLVTPQAIGFQLSAELLIWTAVGGRFSPYGALLGAVAIGLLSSELRERFAYWEVMVALVFLAVVLRYPDGLLGMLGNLARKAGVKFGATDVDSARQGRLPAPPLLHRRVNGAAQAGAPLLAFQDVVVRMNGVTILNGLSLQIPAGGIHCLIGPNGAGKTSSFNVLTGRLPLQSGALRLLGIDVSGARADAVARRGVGRKLQIPSVFASLSVQDNLLIALWAQRATPRDLLRTASRRWHGATLDLLEAEFPFLPEQAHRAAGELSQGQRQMLELAMTVLPEPRLMLLDEPCAGLSAHETHRQIEVIARVVHALGATALVIEHDMSAVEALAQRVHVLHQGQLLASGTLEEIQCHPQVQAVYSGGRK